jgi:uncharacterized protein YfaS (alpha-2-macroglobulin family)
MGTTEISVNRKPHQLDVQVKTDKEAYRPREKVSVSVKVRLPDGSVPPEGAEFALAAVDQGLLELKSPRTWNLLDAMLGERSNLVSTATNKMMIAGKRHMGLKAVATGGGGGHQLTRELFDTLAFWQGHGVVDKNGDATVVFEAKDSLTKFRVAAIATAGVGRFGNAMTHYLVTQPLVVEPAIPELVTQGDRMGVRATVSNATKAAKTVTVSGKIVFTDASGKTSEQALPLQTLPLGPMGSAVLSLGSVNVPEGAVSARYSVATTSDGGDRDEKVSQQSVRPPFTPRVVMSMLKSVDRPASFDVELPSNAVGTLGGVQVALSSSLAGDLAPVDAAMASYLFDSIEFRVSKAVVSGSAHDWEYAAHKVSSNLDSDGLLKYFPTSSRGSVALTAYVLSVARRAGLELPAFTRKSMLDGLSSFASGRLRTGLESDVASRLRAIEALVRNGRFEDGWLAAIRNAPTAELSNASLIDAIDITTLRPGALAGIDLENVLNARLTLTGTRLTLQPEKSTWQYLASPDSDAARAALSILANSALLERWRDQVPYLVVALVARHGKSGAWDTTVGNAYGALAVRAFSAEFEKMPVSGSTEVALDGDKKTVTWADATQALKVDFPWPRGGKGTATVAHSGTGKPWAVAYAKAALDLSGSRGDGNGFRVSKSIEPVRQAHPPAWTVGDVMRVTLHVKGKGDAQQVALRDPIPGGQRVRRAPGSGEGSDTQGVWPTYEEFPYDGYRAFFESFAGGELEVKYDVDLQTPGTFKVPNTRVEATYQPETFAEIANDSVTVNPEK